MKDPQLLIFDMDGLMLDSETLAIQGWKHAATTLGIQIPDELFLNLIGLNNNLCRTIMLENLGPSFDFDTANALLHEYKDNYIRKHGVPLKPGLHHILDKLDEIGIKKCVATSTFYDRAVNKLSIANIAHRFEVIIGGDQVPHSKPAPDIFLKAAEKCEIAPKDCVVLEDSGPGTEAAYRAGMRVIVVPDLVVPSEATRKRAYAICENLFEACEIIYNLHNKSIFPPTKEA